MENPMSLTLNELKKIEKISRELEEKAKTLESLKLKASEEISKLSMKFDLWKLDKKILEKEFQEMAKRYVKN
jgi:hypothetical protein